MLNILMIYFAQPVCAGINIVSKKANTLLNRNILILMLLIFIIDLFEQYIIKSLYLTHL